MIEPKIVILAALMSALMLALRSTANAGPDR